MKDLTLLSLISGLVGAVLGTSGFIVLDKSKYKTEFIILITLYGLFVVLWLIGLFAWSETGIYFSRLTQIIYTICVIVLGVAAMIYGRDHKKPDDTKEK